MQVKATGKVKQMDAEGNPVLGEDKKAVLTGSVRTLSVEYDFGQDLDAMNEIFGEGSETLIFHHARSSMVIALQNYVRSMLEADTPEAEIATALEGWQMPIGSPKKSAFEKLMEKIGDLGADERAALLASLGETEEEQA